MRDSLVRAVNEDLRPLLPRVTCPVLLVWGRHDTATPLADAEVMRARLPDAGLVVVENAGHYVFQEQAAQVIAVVRAFLASAGEAGA
jgi:pimeloyl-ACP methyl ester carboxylesterase